MRSSLDLHQLRSLLTSFELLIEFRFNNNQNPVHNNYLSVVQKDASGRVANKLVGGPVVIDHADPFAISRRYIHNVNRH
jgi:hypothetical protein